MLRVRHRSSAASTSSPAAGPTAPSQQRNPLNVTSKHQPRRARPKRRHQQPVIAPNLRSFSSSHAKPPRNHCSRAINQSDHPRGLGLKAAVSRPHPTSTTPPPNTRHLASTVAFFSSSPVLSATQPLSTTRPLPGGETPPPIPQLAQQQPCDWIDSASLVDQWTTNRNGFQDNLLRLHDPARPDAPSAAEKARITAAIKNREDPRVGLYVNTPAALRILYQLLKLDPGFVAMDLEFGNNSAFLPSLELMQVSTQYGLLAIIDVTALNGYMRPMIDLFNEKTLIMHGSGQDIQMLNNMQFQYDKPCQPKLVRDTQIIAAFVGVIPHQIGLGKLVAQEVEGIVVPKGLSASDWTSRPLTQTQLAYAFNDVRYLHIVHDNLMSRARRVPTIHVPKQLLTQSNHLTLRSIRAPVVDPAVGSVTSPGPIGNGDGDNDDNAASENRYQRLEILDEALAKFSTSSRHAATPDNAWLDIAASQDLSELTPAQLEAVQVLSKFRQISGYRRNQRPNSLFRDQTLVYIAQNRPTAEQIKAEFGSVAFIRSNAAVIANLLEATERQLVKPIVSSTLVEAEQDNEELVRKRRQREKLHTPRQQRVFVSFLAILENIAHQLSINTELICNQGELRHIVVTLLDELDRAKSARALAQAAHRTNPSENPPPPRADAPFIDIDNLPPSLAAMTISQGFRRDAALAPFVHFINGAQLSLSLGDDNDDAERQSHSLIG